MCSRYGQRVAAYYTVAWFDRYLKGREDRRIARDALARLTATTFDDSADVSAIDMGMFDPAAGNVPVTIEGLPVVDRLSFYRTSGYWLGKGRAFQCEDMRTGLRSGQCHSFARAAADASPPRSRWNVGVLGRGHDLLGIGLEQEPRGNGGVRRLGHGVDIVLGRGIQRGQRGRRRTAGCHRRAGRARSGRPAPRQ